MTVRDVIIWAVTLVVTSWLVLPRWVSAWRAELREKRHDRELLARARLTANEAIAIGTPAHPHPEGWLVASLIERDDHLVWTVHDLNKGASATVEVEDATGLVLAVNHYPGR